MSSLIKVLSGRKKESLVWTYFEEQLNLRKSKCLVADEKGKVCGHLVAGKNATNLKSHLEKHHSEVFKKMTENEHERRTSVKRKLDEPGERLCRNYVVIFLIV